MISWDINIASYKTANQDNTSKCNAELLHWKILYLLIDNSLIPISPSDIFLISD